MRHPENAESSRKPRGSAVGSTAKVSSCMAFRDRAEACNRSSKPSWWLWSDLRACKDAVSRGRRYLYVIFREVN